jgi:hypothetical protein
MKKICTFIFIIFSLILFSKEYNLIEVYDIPLFNYKNLKADLNFVDINLYYSMKNNIKMTLKNNERLFPDISFKPYLNTFNINENLFDNSKTFSLFKKLLINNEHLISNWNGSGRITIYTTAKFDNVIFSNYSGNINIKDINVKENCVLKSVNGNISLKNLNVHDLDINNIQGNIESQNIMSSGSINMNSKSSNIILKNGIYFENYFNILTQESDIYIENLYGEYTDIRSKKLKLVIMSEKIKKIDIESDFGDIKIFVKDKNFSINLETQDGDISYFGEKHDKTLKKQKNNTNNFLNIKIKSGNIYIEDISNIKE